MTATRAVRQTPRDWLAPRTSLFIVLVLCAVWGPLAFFVPAATTWLHIDAAAPTTDEGPIDALQNVLLPVEIALWAWIAFRCRGERLHLVLASLMVLQLVVVLGEEVDWGRTLGFPGLPGHRNLRMWGRDVGLLQRWDDAIAPAAYFLFFLLSPLVPVAALRRWRERAAPVRAERGDALAVAALPLFWFFVKGVGGGRPSMEVVQLGGYLVVGVVTLRVVRALRTRT